MNRERNYSVFGRCASKIKLYYVKYNYRSIFVAALINVGVLGAAARVCVYSGTWVRSTVELPVF